MYAWLRRLFSSPNDKTPAQVIAAPVVVEDSATPSAPQPMVTASWMQRSEVNANFTERLFGSSGYSDLFTNQLEVDILAALDKIVKSSDSGANLVRRMPGVIPQLLQSLRTEEFSGAELARKISHDVVLVAEVTRLANSSSYKPSQPISSIEHAVLVLGQTGLRQLITGVAFKPIIDLKSGHFTKAIAPQIWDQSEQCALASRMLAMDTSVDPFEAFLAGLVQNVGLIVSLRVLDQMSDGRQRLGSGSFCNSLLRYARTLSCSIGREWRFPDAVTGAIEEQGGNSVKAAMSPLGQILSMGDYLSKVHMLGGHDSFIKDLSDKERACLTMLRQLEE